MMNRRVEASLRFRPDFGVNVVDQLVGRARFQWAVGLEALVGSEERLGYFGIIRYGYSFEVWNPDRFDLSARLIGQENQNLAKYIGNGRPQHVILRMDSWLAV